MTKKEYEKCEKLMLHAISIARRSKEEFKKSESLTDTIKKDIAELTAQNYLGYAEGINQVLVTLKFKHHGMKELTDLL